jgi:hypothetical protein
MSLLMFNKYRDDWGLICKVQTTGNLDGGDTAANEATRLLCEFLLYGDSPTFRAEYERVMNLLEYAPGQWRRHPDTSKWYAQPGFDRWSRDQSIPTLCLMAIVGDHERARRFYANHLTRGLLFMPNVIGNGDKGEKKPFGDPTLLEYNALLIRACGFESKYLNLMDIESLIGSYYRRYCSKDRDVRNHVLIMITTQIVKPTKNSRRAAKVYASVRMLNDIYYWWSDRRSSGEPPIGNLLAPVAAKYLLGGIK